MWPPPPCARSKVRMAGSIAPAAMTPATPLAPPTLRAAIRARRRSALSPSVTTSALDAPASFLAGGGGVVGLGEDVVWKRRRLFGRLFGREGTSLSSES